MNYENVSTNELVVQLQKEKDPEKLQELIKRCKPIYNAAKEIDVIYTQYFSKDDDQYILIISVFIALSKYQNIEINFKRYFYFIVRNQISEEITNRFPDYLKKNNIDLPKYRYWISPENDSAKITVISESMPNDWKEVNKETYYKFLNNQGTNV